MLDYSGTNLAIGGLGNDKRIINDRLDYIF